MKATTPTAWAADRSMLSHGSAVSWATPVTTTTTTTTATDQQASAFARWQASRRATADAKVVHDHDALRAAIDARLGAMHRR